VTVAKNIEFKDRAMNCGAQLVRSVANDTNNIAGDGTTTATVLTRAIYAGGIKAVAAGMNPMDLKRGIDHAVEKVLVALKEMTQPISTREEISAVCGTGLCAYFSPCTVMMFNLILLYQRQRHNYVAWADLDSALRCPC
jgi:chaperonin GroEL (HSP60 family)